MDIPKKSELRRDYIQEKYVIIAPQRARRPHIGTTDDHVCFFCRDTLDPKKILSFRGASKKNWDIAVIPNIYPAVTLENPAAYGQQEVVIEAPAHKMFFEDLSVAHISNILSIYAERTKAITKNKKIEYVLIFKNEGDRAGASIMHAHSQIFASSFLPPNLLDKSQKVQEYKLRHGTCVYCDTITHERKGPRMVWEDTHIIAFTPYASMHHYEVWIMPKRHIDNVLDLTAKERMSFAKILKRLVHKIHGLNLPYNYYFHQVIHDEDQHLYMKITPRGSVWAGIEIGSGIIINTVSPESAAEYYRGKNQ